MSLPFFSNTPSIFHALGDAMMAQNKQEGGRPGRCSRCSRRIAADYSTETAALAARDPSKFTFHIGTASTASCKGIDRQSIERHPAPIIMSALLELPLALQTQIFRELNARDLGALCCTCRALKEHANQVTKRRAGSALRRNSAHTAALCDFPLATTPPQ
jgi:hypothetical protein